MVLELCKSIVRVCGVVYLGTGPFNVSRAFTSNFSGRHGWRKSCSSSEGHSYREGETMTLTRIRCPYCDGKNVEEQRTYTIKCGAPRTLYHLPLLCKSWQLS